MNRLFILIFISLLSAEASGQAGVVTQKAGIHTLWKSLIICSGRLN